MTEPEFHHLLEISSRQAYEFAKNYVAEDMPDVFKYSIRLNVSQDDPALQQFDIYPEDNHMIFKNVSKEKVADVLLRKGNVPVWIDINVESITKHYTVLHLLCAGRHSDDPEEFYYSTNGTGPFGVKSPIFPIGYKNDGTKFSVKKKRSFFDCLFNR